MEMVTLTRLDCALASAGLMRLALANAVRHAKHRTVFQSSSIDQPVMMQVLADLALHSEAATALAFRLAGSFDRAADGQEAAFRRLMTPVIKYFVCKTAPSFVYEAMECLGGNGYVEDGLMARTYREAPLNAIWEGSGNVMASIFSASCNASQRLLKRSSRPWSRPQRRRASRRCRRTLRKAGPARGPPKRRRARGRATRACRCGEALLQMHPPKYAETLSLPRALPEAGGTAMALDWAARTRGDRRTGRARG